MNDPLYQVGLKLASDAKTEQGATIHALIFHSCFDKMDTRRIVTPKRIAPNIHGALTTDSARPCVQSALGVDLPEWRKLC